MGSRDTKNSRIKPLNEHEKNQKCRTTSFLLELDKAHFHIHPHDVSCYQSSRIQSINQANPENCLISIILGWSWGYCALSSLNFVYNAKDMPYI
jgi:hypothetical protein